MLAFTYCLFATFSALAIADFDFPDIAGVYNIVAGSTQFCNDTVAFTRVSPRFNAESVLFGGVPCTDSRASIYRRSSDDVDARLGVYVVKSVEGTKCGNPDFLTCNGMTAQICHLWFVRPVDEIWQRIGTLGAHRYKKNERYFSLRGKNVDCLYRAIQGSNETSVAEYRKQSASPLPTQDPTSMSKRDEALRVGTEPILAIEESNSIWIWLGPVLGAISTVAAALLSILCVQKRARQKHSKESNDKPAQGPQWDKC